MCLQTGEKREDCVRRNILYESECVRCGAEMTGDEVELERNGSKASMYVGETARSLFERTSEHWQAADSLKEESHMVQHREESHKGEEMPDFKFRVVKTFKTALERQIAEAIRIEMRGNILNRRGEFNRCSLTRLGVDKQWEDERWKTSWEEQEWKEQEVVSLEESRKTMRGEDSERGNKSKRRKLMGGAVEWGETMSETEAEKQAFLSTRYVEPQFKGAKQSTLQFMTGIEWQAYVLVKELVWGCVDVAWCSEEVTTWEAEDMPVPGPLATPVRGTVPEQRVNGGERVSGPTQQVMGGQGLNSKKRCKRLPGTSATQRSVADFFLKKSKCVERTNEVCEQYCEVYQREETLDKQLRLEMARRYKMRWNECVSKDPNDESSREVMSGSSGVVSRKLPSPEIKHPLILENEISFEELTRGRGGGRPDSNNICMSPSSKKVVKKCRSVSEICDNFLSKNQVIDKHALCSSQSQNWRQKLMQFKPTNLGSGGNNS